MMRLRPSLFALACVGSIGLLSGCVYDNEPPRKLGPDNADGAYKPEPGPGDSTSSSGGGYNGKPGDPPPPSTTPTSPSPMLVEIDSDQTMNAKGGDGVGVFIEYGKGGHWHVWWTCDTTQTRQSCDFAVSASATAGNVSNVDATELAGGFVTSSTASRVDAKSTTTTEVHGIRFDTNAGAVVTIEASVGGLKDGAFLFFVQDGKVNGGFSGKLTNPLQVQGSAP